MQELKLKIIGKSKYEGISRDGSPYSMTTLELDYKGEKVKIKCYNNDAKVGDFAVVRPGIKRTLYGPELTMIVDGVIEGDKEEE